MGMIKKLIVSTTYDSYEKNKAFIQFRKLIALSKHIK